MDTYKQDSIPVEAKALVPALAHALWIWEAAALELGDLAILAGDASPDGLIVQVATWRSGRRVIALGRVSAAGINAHAITTLDPADQPMTMQRLTAAVAAAPGTVAVIRDGNAAITELVLEIMPAWGRVVLATRAMDPATIDFYNNVHRKGCRILTVPASPAQMDDEPWRGEAGSHVARAIRVLQSRRLLAAPDK